jgi:hypothetical protein
MWDLEVHRLGGTHSCFVSEAARAHALAVGVHAARMTVIRNGVDTETFRPRTDARVGELVVGYAGRLSPEKNPALFVRVAARLRAQGSPARFVVIGDGPMRGELETLSDALAVRDAITFAGECRDMPARYRALDLLLLTSWHEGTPLALLEAMASGVPVVATDVGGVAEIIVAGSTGCLAPPGDEWRLTELASTLLQDRETLDRYGRAARQHTRAHFSIDEQVRRTSALLHEIARGAPRAKPHTASSHARTRPRRIGGGELSCREQGRTRIQVARPEMESGLFFDRVGARLQHARHVRKRVIAPFVLLGRHAIRGNPQLVFAQIRVVRGEHDAGIGGEPGKHELRNVELVEQEFERRAEERRMARLQDRAVAGLGCEELRHRRRRPAAPLAFRDDGGKVRFPATEVVVRIDDRHALGAHARAKPRRLRGGLHRMRRHVLRAVEIERVHEVDEEQCGPAPRVVVARSLRAWHATYDSKLRAARVS